MRQWESKMLARGGRSERPPAAAADSWRGLTLMPPSVLQWATAVARDEVDTAVTVEPRPVWRSSGAERSTCGRRLVPREPTGDGEVKANDFPWLRRIEAPEGHEERQRKSQNASSNNCHGCVLGLWLGEWLRFGFLSFSEALLSYIDK